AEDGIRAPLVTGVQTCALPILAQPAHELAHTSPPVVTSLPTPSPGQLPAFDQAVPGATREYVVISGDNFTTIGKRFGVSSAAMEIGRASCRGRGEAWVGQGCAT